MTIFRLLFYALPGIFYFSQFGNVIKFCQHRFDAQDAQLNLIGFMISQPLDQPLWDY